MAYKQRDGNYSDLIFKSPGPISENMDIVDTDYFHAENQSLNLIHGDWTMD